MRNLRKLIELIRHKFVDNKDQHIADAIEILMKQIESQEKRIKELENGNK